MMDFEEGASSSFCSRAGQKRAHSQISSAGHNGSTTSLDSDSRSGPSAWHRPTTLLPPFTPNFSTIPVQLNGRVPSLDTIRHTQQTRSLGERAEGTSRSRLSRSAPRETLGEDADQFMRLQPPLPPPNQRFAGDGFDYRRPVISGERSMNRTSSLQSSQENEISRNAIDLTGSDSEEDNDSGPSQSDSNRSIPLLVPAVVTARSTLADYLIQRRDLAHAGGRQPQRPSRPPRFGREVLNDNVEVIDLASEEDGEPSNRPSNGNSGATTRGSPEVQVLSSRPISPARRRPELLRVNRTRPSSLTPAPSDYNYDLLDDGNLEDFMEDVQIIRENAVRPPPRRGFEMMHTEIFHRIQHALDHVAGRPVGRRHANRVPVPRNFLLPGELDFGTAAFNLGYQDLEPEVPTYDAPAPPPNGFTRSPQEDEVLLCPNCDRELCSGDSDMDRQVWVLKACGHVYCGTCATNRSISAAKRKERNVVSKHAPFKNCKVDGCGRKCTGQKTMFQLFL